MSDNFDIDIKHVSKSYGERTVLDDISFQVAPGEIHGFLGPNGAGKTTTLKLITGLLSLDHGQISLFNQPVNQQSLRQVGVLLDQPPLIYDFKVEEFLVFIAKLHQVPTEKIWSRTNHAIKKLSLEEVRHRVIANLSKGYKQRVGIAAAIIHDPRVLILDEPTVGLDPSSIKEIRDLIIELKGEHTILLSSHLLSEVDLVCDKVTIISDGVIKASGTTDEIRRMLHDLMILEIEVQRVQPESIETLSQHSYVHDIKVEGNKLFIKVESQSEVRHQISKYIVESQMGLLQQKSYKQSLEDIFIQLTSDTEGKQ